MYSVEENHQKIRVFRMSRTIFYFCSVLTLHICVKVVRPRFCKTLKNVFPIGIIAYTWYKAGSTRTSTRVRWDGTSTFIYVATTKFAAFKILLVSRLHTFLIHSHCTIKQIHFKQFYFFK